MYLSGMRWGLLFLSVLGSWYSFAQPYREIETNNVRIDPDWVESFKSSGFCWAYDILVDDTGNTYSCGYFKNALIMGDSVLTPKLSTGGSGQESTFLIKRDASGKLLWMFHIGGNNRPSSLRFSKDGSLILLGLQQAEYSYFIEPSGKETQLAREGNGRIFIARISTEGSLIKAVSLPNESPQYGHDIKEDSKGNWYIAGEENFRRPSRPSYVQNRFLLIKLNADWDIEWVQRGDTAQTSIFSSLVLVGKDIYTGGSYHQSLKIDEFQLDRKKQEQYPLLVKWNSKGKPEWVRDELNTFPTGHISNLVNDSKGNIYAWAGSSYSYAMLTKFSSKGEKLWAIEQKGKASVYTEKMLIDSKDRLYLCGQSYGNVFGSTKPDVYSFKTKGGTDPYLASYSSDGELLWIKVYGGKGTDYCKSIAINDSNLYSFGWTNTNLDFFNKQVKGHGYIFYTAKFQLKDLAFMDKSVQRSPLDTAEKWPKIDLQSCQCESKPNAKIPFASSLKNLLSYEEFQKLSGWSIVGGDSNYHKLFFINFQSSVGHDQAFYSLKLVSFKPILLESPERTYRVELNSCDNQSRHRDLSLTLSYSEPIRRYDRSFDREEFDSSAASYLNLMQYVGQINDDDLLLRYLFNHPHRQYDQLLPEFEEAFGFKLDPKLEDEEQIIQVILSKMEEKEVEPTQFILTKYVLEKDGLHPIRDEERRRLDDLFYSIDSRLTTTLIDEIIEPSVSLHIDKDWLRLEVDGKIIHPWNPFTNSAEFDSNGNVKPGSVLVEFNKFSFSNESGLQIGINTICMPRSEIGNTGILVDFNQVDLIDPKNKYLVLNPADFPILAPQSKNSVPPTFINPASRGPILNSYSGLLVKQAKVRVPFDGQNIFCDARQLAINNDFFGGTILLDAEAELEGGSETGRILVHSPNGDAFYTAAEIEKIFLGLGMDSVQCTADRYGVRIYFVYR